MLGKPPSFSQWRRVPTGTRARRASSARDSLAAPRNVRRCPPKFMAAPRRPVPAHPDASSQDAGLVTGSAA
jgi:hypothetical protein